MNFFFKKKLKKETNLILISEKDALTYGLFLLGSLRLQLMSQFTIISNDADLDL